MDVASITAIGAIFTGIVIIFLKFVNDNRLSQDVRDKLFATALDRLTEQGKEQVKASNKVATETAKSAREAKERNGHLAEISEQGTARIIEHMSEHDTKVADLLAVSNERVAVKVERVRTDLKEA